MTRPPVGAIVGVSVTREFVEFCTRGETRWVVNSTEFFPHVIETLCAADPRARFVVETAGGWETGVLRAVQVARVPVSVAESTAMREHFELSTTEDVDADIVRRYGEALWDDLVPAARVERVLSAGERPPAVAGWWQRHFAAFFPKKSRAARFS